MPVLIPASKLGDISPDYLTGIWNESSIKVETREQCNNWEVCFVGGQSTIHRIIYQALSPPPNYQPHSYRRQNVLHLCSDGTPYTMNQLMKPPEPLDTCYFGYTALISLRRMKRTQHQPSIPLPSHHLLHDTTTLVAIPIFCFLSLYRLRH